MTKAEKTNLVKFPGIRTNAISPTPIALQKELREGLLGHDGVEVLQTYLAVAKTIRTLDHLLKLLFAHSFAEFLKFEKLAPQPKKNISQTTP